MLSPHSTFLVAQQHIADLHRAAGHHRLAHSTIDARPTHADAAGPVRPAASPPPDPLPRGVAVTAEPGEVRSQTPARCHVAVRSQAT